MVPLSRPGDHFQSEEGVTFVREEGGHFPSEFPPNDQITYFCKKKKSEPGVDLKELQNFHKFYLRPSKDNPDKSIAESFTNLDPEKLWVNWMKKAK